MVRAKFQCVEKMESKNGHSVKLEPVISGSDENKEFYKYTPNGKVELLTINVAAADQFKVGGFYYVDFTESV